jgi:hypothetical protein
MKTLSNEKGFALFMALILSVIMLALTSAVLYMVIEGTQSSGREKRYKTALEASGGGLDISYDLIGTRGETADLLAALSGSAPAITTPVGCKPSVDPICEAWFDYDANYTGLTTKLRIPTSYGTEGVSCWSGCDSSLPIDPNNSATYDMSFTLGEAPNPVFDVFVKIVDTTPGNSAAETGLEKMTGIEPSSGEIKVPPINYLYTIEVLSQSADNPEERAKSSVLYAY